MSTLVIKSLPANLHQKLKSLAARNLRSVNKEVIRLIEAGLVAERARQPLPKAIHLRSRRMQTIDDLEAAIDDDAE